MSVRSWARDWALPTALAAAAGLLLLAGLGNRSLDDWDEAIYARVAREMLQRHDFLTPYWNFAPWYQKPPLYMWIEAGLFSFVGQSDWAARLPSAIAGVGVVLLTYLIGRRLYGTLAGAIAAAFLLACLQFLESARFGTTDVMLTLFFCAAAYFYLLSRERPRYWLLVGGALGAAAMAKGAAVAPGAAAIGVALLCDRRQGELASRMPWLGLLVALAVALPWHAAMLVTGKAEFASQYLGYHVLTRASQPIEGHTGGWLAYPIFIRSHDFPWAYLAPFSIALAAREAVAGRASWVMLVLAAVVLGLYTAVQTKLIWYMVPLLPALAVTYGLMFAQAVRDRDALAGAGFAAAGLLAAFWVPNIIGPYPRWLSVALVSAVVVAGGAAVLARRWAAPAAAAGVSALFLLVSLHYVLPLYQPAQAPIVSLARSAGADSPGGRLLVLNDGAAGIVNTPVWPDALYYSGRQVQAVPDAGQLVADLRADHSAGAIVARSDLQRDPGLSALAVVSGEGPLVYVVAR